MRQQRFPGIRGGVISIVALVLTLGGGFLLWRSATDQGPAAGAAAARAAAAIAGRTITDGSFGTTVGPDEAADLAETVRGLGTLRARISVRAVQLSDDGRGAVARLRAEWVIHEGKPSWEQDAYLRLVRGADGWTGVWQRDLIASGLQPGEVLRAVRLAPTRGELLGQRDERLVWNQDAKRIGLDKTLVGADAQPRAARALAKAVGIDPGVFAAKVARYGPKAFVEAAVVRAVGDESWRTLDAVRTLPGTRILDVVWPLARSATFARQLLGNVGEATHQAIRDSQGAVRAGDLVGLAGLQQAHNQHLMGTTGFVVQALPNGDPQAARDLFRVAALPGSPLRLTIDAELQERAERLLPAKSERAAVVVLRASDGALLALASTPGTSTATGQRVYPAEFVPVTAIPGLSPAAALRALALTEPFQLGVNAYGAELAGGPLRLSPIAMAVATASVARGGTVRPQVVAGPPQLVPGGISPEQAEAVRRQLRERAARGPGVHLSRIPGPPVLADGDGRFWVAAARGDQVVAVFDSGKGAAAVAARMLRGLR